MDHYDEIAEGYDELYQEEQLKKCLFISENIDLDIKGKKIIDVGCGTGIATDHFNCEVGVDPSEKLLKIAEKKFPHIQFMEEKAEELSFEDNEFDVAISLTAIQNFDDVEKGLAEIKRIAKAFVLTFLKKSEKKEMIEGLIKKLFKIKKAVEEEKDMIYFCMK